MIFTDQFIRVIKSKKSNRQCAKKLNISVQEYIQRKKEFKQKEDYNNLQKDVYIIALEEKILEFSENIEQGTANIKAVATKEPQSAKDIEKILKLDKEKWKLSSYWNKQHKDNKGVDYWVISAMIVKKKENELSIEDVEKTLNNIFQQTVPVIVKKDKKLSNEKALFIYTSDKHIAAYVNESEAIYKNTYGEYTFRARMLAILNEVSYLVDTFGKFKDIFIIDLGDRMDGLNAQTTRGAHKLPQNMTDKEAFETAISVERTFYDILFQSNFAENYQIISNACSNHGGVFDYMVSRALEMYVNAAYPFVKTFIQEKFIEHIEYGKHVLMFTHGKDTEDMKHGFPLHVNDKTENYINKYLMYKKINPEDKMVSVIKGDLHKDASETTYNFRYKNVLSLFGGSKWIGTNFGPTKSGCSFDIIEYSTDRIFEHKI